MTASERMEDLVVRFAPQLGRDAHAYGNHVRRVFGLVCAQGPHLTPDERDQVAIAAVFHDIGLWLDDTLDYLEPSRGHAAGYLREQGLESWDPVISDLIVRHHQVRPVRDQPLVEAFRRADLCDVSGGLLQRGIPAGEYARLIARYPVDGFRGRLLRFGVAWMRKHPLRPLPMMRW